MGHILITGAGRGLGKETAIALSKAGHAVAINYCRSEKEARLLAETLGNAIALRADVGDLRQVIRMAEEINDRWGRLDALINNAGVAIDNLLIKTPTEDWDEVMRVNLKGAFNAAQAFAPLLIKSGGGHILNISSRSGLRGKPGQAAYSAGKAGLIGLTFSLAKELAPYNIRVNAVLPGYMPTSMGEGAATAMKKAKEESLTGRLSDPLEVAGFIAWLLGTEGVTGQVFTLDSRP